MILVTGGAGFIGANFILDWLAAGDEGVVHLDKLTHPGQLRNPGAWWGETSGPAQRWIHGCSNPAPAR